MTVRRTLAGPCGLRRPCSHCRTDAVVKPKRDANSAWDKPRAFRIRSTSTCGGTKAMRFPRTIFRHAASANGSAPSCRAYRAISASLVASTFAQSIARLRADDVAIAACFPRICFAERDDADRVASLRKRGEEDASFDFSERTDSDFAIIITVVLPFQARIFKQARGCAKRQPALTLVLCAFGRVELYARQCYRPNKAMSMTHTSVTYNYRPLKIAFGIMACTPLVASTTWVTW